SQPHAKEFGDAVGSQAPKADLAAALKDFMDRKVALEDEVAAILDLADGVEARQVDQFALPLGKLRSQDQCPIVQLLLNVICGLSRSAAACSAATSSTARNALSFLRKATLAPIEFLLDEGVAIEVVGGLEWQE